MPLVQRQAAEVFLVELEDASQARNFVEFHSTAAAFPMPHAFWFHAHFCRNGGLFDSQLNSALPDELRHTSIVRFVHSC